jgi:hypothetical protein
VRVASAGREVHDRIHAIEVLLLEFVILQKFVTRICEVYILIEGQQI